MGGLFVFLGVFLVLAIVVKVPVAFSMGISSVVAFIYAGLPLLNMSQGAFSALDSVPFLAIPFFMMAGTLMEYSGISKALLNLVDAFIGRVRGSLGVVAIVASAAFGVLTGSAMATISAIGKIISPEMLARGYRKGYVGALLSATCFLGILIPPSVPGILYALAASTSVTKVWMSTIGPGILFCIAYIVINYFKHGRTEEKSEERVPFGPYMENVGARTVEAIPALLMPVIIFGGIYSGICTATEAGAVSVIYGVLYYVIKKIVKKGTVSSNLKEITLISGLSTAVISVIVIFANVGSRSITLSGASNMIATWVIENIHSPVIFLIIVNVIYLIMGTFLDINCSLLLMTPLLLPAAKALGIDPVHFGAITLVNLSVGFMTPPFATGIFMSCKIVGADFVEVVKELGWFLVAGIIIILITTYVPAVPMFFANMVN